MLIFASPATLANAADHNGPETPGTLTLERIVDPLVRGDFKIDGASSCAATACHGGVRAGVSNNFAMRGSEYPLWLERDPHARSWRTICGEKSRAILQRLNIIHADGEILNKAAFDNCLACHNSTKQFEDSKSSELIREGVGCNSCHGPSEQWKSTHYLSSWQSTYQSNSQETRNVNDGFVSVSDIIARARVCASCHVGDRDRDMNHEIIAAGHPALYYEFTTYHHRLPKHWREPTSSDLQHYESAQWIAGQIAGLDASLTLLEARANKSLPISQWPDFAIYECSACHQQLRPGSLDYTPSKIEPGVAHLSRWNRFGIEVLLDAGRSTKSFSDADQHLLDSISELERVTRFAPELSAERVTHASQAVRWQLDRWLNSRDGRSQIDNMSASRLRDVLIHAGGHTGSFSNWESATQFYLASVAARAAWPDGLQGSSLSTARELRSILTFKPGTNGQQTRLWQTTSGFKKVPNKAGIQHWHAISSDPVH